MVNIPFRQENFALGETDKNISFRISLDVHRGSLQWAQNFFLYTQGSARYRPPFVFAHETRRGADGVLIPFRVIDGLSYELECTDQFIRFWRDDGVVVDSAVNISGATQANPVVVTATAHGYANGDEVFINGVVGMTELNGKSYVVNNVTANTFELRDRFDSADIDGTGFTAYTSGGESNLIIEIASPYTAAQIDSLDYDIADDVMYIVHPSHAPYKLTRVSDTVWTLATYVRTNDPFTGAGLYPSVVHFYESRLYMGAPTNSPKGVWGSRAPTTAGVTRYDDFTTGTNPDDAVTFIPSAQTKLFWLQGLDEYMALGDKYSVAKLTGSPETDPIAPDSINAKSVEYYGVADIKPTLVDQVLVYIERGGKRLDSFEYDSLADRYKAIDRNLVNKSILNEGVKQIVYQKGELKLVWVLLTNGEVRVLTFDREENVSGWTRLITDGEVKSIGVTSREDAGDRLWAIIERTVDGTTRHYVEYLEDFEILRNEESFFTGVGNAVADTDTYLRYLSEEQRHIHRLDSALTYDGSVYATTTLTPGATSGASVTFTAGASIFDASMVGRELVKRSIDGVGYGRAEITAYVSGTQVTCNILQEFDSITAITASNWYLTADDISGLGHLEGRTVSVVTDGGVHRDLDVLNGAVTLDYQSSVVHVGLPYTGLLKTHNLEAANQEGASSGRTKNITGIAISFINTLGVLYGSSVYNTEAIRFRNMNNRTSTPVPLFSGTKPLTYQDIAAIEKNVVILQVAPLPCEVTTLTTYVEIGSR